MDLTTPATGYSVFLVGVFLAMLVVARLLPLLIRLARCVRRLILEYLCYRYVVSRHAILGPWSAATFLLHLVYTSTNLGCVYWGPATVSEAASRAGILSMINMAPVFLSTHLSLLADLFGVSLRTYRRIHRSCSITAASLLLMHSILSLAESGSFSLEGWPNRFAVMGISAVFLLLLLSIRILRQVSYELFLRLHQALAGLFVFCAAKHLVSLEKDRDFWLPIYAFAGVCAALTVVQGSLLIYRNKAWGQPCPRAMIQHAEGTIEVTVVLSRPCRFHAGQYIVLWVPSLSLWSSHPFTVVSWSPERQSTLKLVIEPRKGFTDRLLRRSTLETSRLMCHRALFSGPHGHRLSLAPYKTVIIFAEAAGLTAVLPHLKELIHAYKKGQGLARRIHLVWQVHSYAQLAAKKPLIDEILIDDSLEDGYILCGSIYDTSADVKKRCGRHYRITLSPGQPDVQEIIRKEHTGSFIFKEPDEDPDEAYEDAKRPTQPLGMLAAVDQEDAIRKAQRFKDADGDTLVLVSAREAMRDAVRAVVRGYIREGFHLEELDYQPA